VGLGDISGIFSRFFVVGFYVPSFFAVVFLNLVFKEELEEPRILVLGGAALLLALLLLGVRDVVWFKFSGYWGQKKHMIGGERPPKRPTPLRRRDKFRWNDFRAATEQYRDYVAMEFGLDTWVAWPFIQASFSDRERELHVDSLANVHFFQNACLGTLFVGVGLAVAAFRDPVLGGWAGSAIGAVACVPLAYLCYRGAVAAVELWGENKIVSAVAHRNELYTNLGFKQPRTTAEEHTVGVAATAMLYGESTGPVADLRRDLG
jgi:hypothetical protein